MTYFFVVFLENEEDESIVFFFQAEDGIRDVAVTGVQTCALPISGEKGTAANALVGRFPELASVGPQPREGGLVHRLDTDTSGLLLAARTDAAHAMLRAQFIARTVEKGYLALVAGELHAGGEISLPLAHDPHDARKMRAASDAEYVEAHGALRAATRFEPV